jgi:hypothetical protein
MKYLLMMAMLLSAAANANDLSKLQASELETELDNICGDTWCEGDFNWRFENAKCDFAKESCTIDLTLEESVYYEDEEPGLFDELYISEIQKFPGVSEDEGYYGGPVNIWTKTCKMTGMKSAADVLEGEYSYSERTYEIVTDCISDMEDEFYKMQDQAFVLSRLRACVPKMTVSNFEVEQVRGEGYSRRFYNEEQEYNNLVSYTERVNNTSKKYESGLRTFISHTEREENSCSLALAEIESSYYILGFNIGKTYKEKKHSMRLTKKRRWRETDSLNFTIDR